MVGEWHRRDIRRRGHRVRPRVRVISLGRAVRVCAIVEVRDSKGVGGLATARLCALVVVLESGIQKVIIRVVGSGSDLRKIDKEVWRS